jgi:uncharacterized protein (TIGR02996 family)
MKPQGIRDCPDAVQLEREELPYNPHRDPDFLPFVEAMRKAPTDNTLALVAADWLEDHTEGDHARVVRAMCESQRVGWSYSVELGDSIWKAKDNIQSGGRYDPSTPFDQIPPSNYQIHTQINCGLNWRRWFPAVPDRSAADRDQSTVLVWVRRGFVYCVESSVEYLLTHFDEIHKYNPVSSYSVLRWAHEFNGEPIIRPLARRGKETIPFRVAGKVIELSEEEYETRLLGGITNRERGVSEACFEKRWPGVKFVVNF